MTQENLCKNHKPTPLSNPIAASGDKNQIPASSSDDGVVNVANGIPSRYSLPRAAGGKSMGRRDMNGLFNLVSQPEYFQQYMGRTLWDSGVASTGYPKGAKVWFYGADGSSAEYVSKVDDNKGTPGVSTDWVKTGSANGLEIDPSSGALSGYVSIGGTQTVTGAKTFSVSPTVPTIEYSSLSESGTRAINETTLLSAISSSSVGGMFIDTGTPPAYIVGGYDAPIFVAYSSVIYGGCRSTISVSFKHACQLLYSPNKPKSDADGFALAFISLNVTDDSSVCIGSFGPFYVKQAGYFWVGNMIAHPLCFVAYKLL